jgi:hypothetical protein
VVSVLLGGFAHWLEFANPLILLVPRLGLESSESTSKIRENLTPTHLGTHQDSDLVKIITAWSHLPCPLKAAILAIIATSESQKEKEKAF